MKEPAHQIDVAFSFLARDEDTAVALSDLLSDRVSTFLYSRRQEELAGTDGEKTLSAVFGEESRVVAILHRKAWGTTPWTRIEETAIRNRAYDDGYDFCLFIPLELPAKLPLWVPKTEIYLGLERWGLEGAASVLEAQIQRRGGSPREESAVDRAQRLERDLSAERDRTSFLHSRVGVDAAKDELDVLFSELDRLIEKVSHTVPSSNVIGVPDSSGRKYLIHLGHFSVTVAWSQQWANSVELSTLYVKYWDGAPSFPGRISIEEAKELRSRRFDFDRTRSGVHGWKEREEPNRLVSSVQLADMLIKEAVDAVRKQSIDGRLLRGK